MTTDEAIAWAKAHYPSLGAMEKEFQKRQRDAAKAQQEQMKMADAKIEEQNTKGATILARWLSDD